MSITLSPGLRMVALGRYMHWCPGCEAPHFFNTSAQDHPRGLKWTFNSDVKAPTIRPDVRIETPRGPCHYFLTNGRIEFLGDCWHAYRNRTVDLPTFPFHRSHPMRLALGDSIVVHTIATYNGSHEQPAIVNCVWGTDDTRNGPQRVNCTVLPDCGTPFAMTSVQVHDTRPAEPEPGVDAWLPRPSAG